MKREEPTLPFFHPNGAVITEVLLYKRYRVSTPLVPVVVDTLAYPEDGILVEYPANWMATDEERGAMNEIAVVATMDYLSAMWQARIMPVIGGGESE